jgi:uncharacterized protein YlxW (UPF0749 family)
MGLLNYLTATSLDEDYAHVSRRRASPGPADPGRAGRPGLVALVVLGVFGVLVATAAVQTARNADESASSRSALVAQVNERRDELAARRARVVDLQRGVTALRDRDLVLRNEVDGLTTQLGRLGLATGRVPAVGGGIEVTVDDAPDPTDDAQLVHARDLQRLVNGLWEVGAEAISVNGQRLTPLSAIRDAGGSIGVNFVSLRAPYTVLAIGNRKTMGARLLDTTGGQTWATLQSSFGLQFEVTTEESMRLPAARSTALRFAHQPERRDRG